MSAFVRSREDGIPAVELDVQVSGDGKLVVFHDGDLRRLGGVPDRIANTPYHELASIRLSGPPRGKNGTGGESALLTDVGIPLFSHVVEALGPQIILDVEIKSYDDTPWKTGMILAEAVATLGIADRVLVSSFDPRRIWSFRKGARHFLKRHPVPCAAIYAREEEVPWYLRRGAGRLIGGGRIRKPSWRDLGTGKPLPALTIPWTVNDAVVAADLTRRGAAGIISDDPLRLTGVWGENLS